MLAIGQESCRADDRCERRIREATYSTSASFQRHGAGQATLRKGKELTRLRSGRGG